MTEEQDNIDERINSLKSEIKSYGKDIINYINALYSFNNNIPIDLNNDPRNILKMLQIDVTEILKDAQEHTAYTEKYGEDIQACASFIQSLEAVASASSSLEKAEEAILGRNLPLACNVLCDMHNKIESLPGPNNEIGAGAVCEVLRRTAALTQSRFQSRLRRILEHAIQVSRGRIQVLKIIKSVPREISSEEGEGIPLADLWDAVLTTKDGDTMIHGIVLKVWNDVLSPLWREIKCPTPSLAIASDPTVGSESRSSTFGSKDVTSVLAIEFSLGNSKSNAEQFACRMKFPHLLEVIGTIMGFMYTEVFLANDEVLAACYSSLQDPLVDFFPSLSRTLLAILPKEEVEMESFVSSLENPCHEFEQKMNLYGFLSSDEARGNCGPLTCTVEKLFTHFLTSRRTEILAKARSVVLCDYHNTMLGTGDALEDDTSSAGNIGDRQALLEQSGTSLYSPFQTLQFETCQISLACCRLLKLIHEVLRHASADSCGSELAVMLYRTARDCLDIFEGVVQSKYADGIQSVARMGAVFFNDCAYIAHNTTILTHMYRMKLGERAPELTDTIGFMDFIPRFRSIGENCLGDHVEGQKRTLKELITAMNIRAEEDEGEIERGSGANDAEAATRVVKHLHRLRGQWQNILQDSVYERIMGYLLEYVIRTVMKPVFEATYISEVAASDITKAFKELQKANTLFEEPLPVASNNLPVENGGGNFGDGLNRVSSKAMGDLVSWTKFCALADLLEYSLSDISEWLPRRKFAMFTGQELSSLIRALFEDSPRRQTILSSILEMAS